MAGHRRLPLSWPAAPWWVNAADEIRFRASVSWLTVPSL
jgi:hypothetical protein